MTLPAKWISYLAQQPETGMSCQTGRVTLSDGRSFEDVVFIGGTTGEVRGQLVIAFDPAEIVVIELTHRRWDFR